MPGVNDAMSNKLSNKEPTGLTSMVRVELGLRDKLSPRRPRYAAPMRKLRQAPDCTLRLCARYLNLWEDLPAAGGHHTPSARSSDLQQNVFAYSYLKITCF
jgi:hypothetical protein